MQLVQSVSLFPYTRLWRIGKDSELSHTCGGLASIVLLLVVIAVFVYKLVEVFSRSTISVTSDTQYYFESVSTDFPTSSENPLKQAVMTGLFFSEGILSQYSVKAFYNNGSVNNTITLETCTAAHFSMIDVDAGTNHFSQFFDLSRAICLPLNQTYELGGKRFETETRSENEKTVVFELSCPSCSVMGTVDLFTVTSVLDPQNIEKPWSSTLYRKRIVSMVYQQRFYIDLILNKLNSYDGIFPFQSKAEKSEGLSLDKNIEQQLHASNVSFGGVRITLGSSSSDVVITRRCLTVLDIFSYIGGIFSSLIGVFIFMPSYGAYYFQLYLGKKYLKAKNKIDLGFFTYIKDQFTSLLESCNYRTQWKGVKVRNRLREVVNEMLNVVVLQKRIEFLEKGLAVLLEEHQLKSLYLVHSNSLKQMETNFANYKMRKRLLSLFRKRRQRRILDSTQNGSEKKNGVKGLESDVKLEKQREGEHFRSGQFQSLQEVGEHEVERFGQGQTSSDEEQQQQQGDVSSQLKFEQSIEKTLQTLFSEADSKSDLRSQLIFQKLDPYLKFHIKQHLKQKKETQDNLFHFRMVSQLISQNP